MRRRIAFAFVLLAVILLGVFALNWKLYWKQPTVNVEEMFEATLVELARGDLHRVQEVQDLLLRNPQYALESRLLDAATKVAILQPHAALARTLPLPENPAIRWRFQLIAAKALHALGRLPESEALLRDAVELQPNEPEPLRWLVTIYYDLGAMDHALARLDELAVLQPDDFRPHWLSGTIYHDFEQYPSAIQQFRLALDRTPPKNLDPEIRGALARSLVADRRFQEALDFLMPDPKNALQMQIAGRCYFNLGDMKNAQTWADKSAASDPTGVDLALLQADLFAEQGNKVAAIRTLKQAAEKHPHEPALRFQYSQSLRANEQITEADEQLRLWTGANTRRLRMVELNKQAIANPYDRGVREELATLCRELNEPKLAEMWQRAADSLRSRSLADP